MDFEQVVTPDWVREKLRQFNLKNAELATALNVSDSQISQWLSGPRKPTAATKAAIYYFFSGLELQQLKFRPDVLKLKTMHFVLVRIPATSKQYSITWNHIDSNLVVNGCDIDELKYVDITRYKYLLLDPDEQHYSILYEINLEGEELKLDLKAKAELANDFEIFYGYQKFR
jgi:transcriptional regulator with XRE-family HTH domain